MVNPLAAVYVRISDDKAGEAAGVARQEADCRQLADRLGWTVAETYTENDTSAFKRRRVRLPDGSTALRVVRPAFRRLLDDLGSGAVTALIGYDLDRVARDPRDLEDLIDAVEQTKAPARSVTGSLDLSTDSGVTMARVMVAIANQSSRDTARRVARKHVELAEQGRSGGGGIRAYGYEADGMTVREDEAEVIREMARRILAGQSLYAVASWLNESGTPSVRGNAWIARSVHSVVTKARVAGKREHKGEVVGEALWPAVLDLDTWQRVRLALESRAQGSTNQLKRWLTGVLICSHCDHALFGGQGRRTRYWCATPHGGCGKIAIDAQYTEDFVSDLIVGYLSKPDVLADLRAATSSQATDKARIQVATDAAQLKELATLWGTKSITTVEYLTARKEIEARLRKWQGIVRASLPGEVRELVATNIETTWARYTPVQRRQVARIVFPSGIFVKSRAQHVVSQWDATRLLPVHWAQEATGATLRA